MTAQEFAYWLNGFAELSTEPPTAEQWQSIKEHLALTFRKVTPPGPGSTPTVDDLMRAYERKKITGVTTAGQLQATC